MVARPPQIIGRYAIYSGIASGGMASVYFGRLIGGAGFSRTVAVKRLHPHLSEEPEFLSTMIDEARMAARIHHPNVVPTLDVVATDGELLLIMEYVRGESLSRLIRTEGDDGRRVPLPIASAIAIGTLHGLHAAHEATSDRGEPLGIVHRDVSPQNILVGVDGMARVIDFGVAKAAGRLQTTRAGLVKGKIAYMAPEQLAGGEVTRAADVYAMGVVLWETLTGKRLFQGDSDGALVTQVLAGIKDPPSRHAPNNLPAALDALVMKALSLDPAHRFGTARDMADLLLRVIPPAFSTDVGTWCEKVAGEPLSKRAASLAEIESSSDALLGVAAASPDFAPPPSRSEGGGTVRVDLRELGAPRPGVGPALEVAPATFPPEPDGGGRFHASQPSSVSVATPAPPLAVSGLRPPRVVLFAALGVGVLLAGGAAAVVLGGRASTVSGPPVAAVTSAFEAGTPPPLPPQEPAGPTASSEPPAASEAPLAPPPPSSAAPPEPAPIPTPESPPPSPKHASPHAQSAPGTGAPPPKTKSCNPPYEIDSAGHRQYKPECL